MWTEQIPLDDQTRIDVGATACGASGVSLTMVRNGRMVSAVHIADPATALLLLGTIAEAIDHMGWFSTDGRGLVAAAVLSDDQTTRLINALSPGAKRTLAILGETASDQEMEFVGRHVGRALLKAYERVLDSRVDRREATDQ